MNDQLASSNITAARRALITGGEGDLARSISAELLSQQYVVQAPGRNELDLADRNSIVQYVEKHEKPLDLVICNAGATCDKSFYHSTSEDFSAMLEANLSGHAMLVRQVLKKMAKQRSGHVIFISSFAAMHGNAGQAVYAATKAALHGFASSLAREFGSRNVRINVILPGFLETRMTASLNEEQRAKFRQAHVLPQFNTPLQVAKFIAFVDQHLPYTSGQIFNLDSRIHRWS